MKNEPMWQDCLKKLRDIVGETSYETWLLPLNFKELSNDILQLEAPDAFFKSWVENHYLKNIQKTLSAIIKKEITINLSVNSNLLKKPLPSSSYIHDDEYIPNNDDISSIRLNSRFSFDTFIVGASNRMAHAASVAVSEKPGKLYNPLFIYGRSGLGKTHLMQSIANAFIANNKKGKVKVKYLSSEKFTNDLIYSIQHRSTTSFREKYRNVDILLIDDIQFISGKESVQEEFFHTFNVLYDYHKQIVISSDRPPKEIPKLEDRLRTRFGWGLVVDIQPPDFETRVAILKKKLEKETITIPENVLFYIAENISSNIRELEGALVRIIAFSAIEKKEISLDMTKSILKDMVKELASKITPDLILTKVAEYYSVQKEDLKKAKRHKNIVLPKQIAMYIIREMTDMSLPEIGSFFNAKHHTTILHGYKKIKNLTETDKDIAESIDMIVQDIKR